MKDSQALNRVLDRSHKASCGSSGRQNEHYHLAHCLSVEGLRLTSDATMQRS